MFLAGSTLALCSQPTAEVLSPRARRQDNLGVEGASNSNHIVVKAAKNSSKLFILLTEDKNSSGTCHRHALPETAEYPPRPLGHASENRR
jgi:hypothetical protein